MKNHKFSLQHELFNTYIIRIIRKHSKYRFCIYKISKIQNFRFEEILALLEGGVESLRKNKKSKLIYFDKNDWEIIEKKSEDLGMSTTRYIKENALTGVVIIKKNNITRELIYEINKIGVNINQVVEVINTYKNDFEHTKRLDEILENINSINRLIKGIV